MGGDKGRGDDDEKKRGWLIEEWGGATIKEKVDIYLLTVADELVIFADRCAKLPHGNFVMSDGMVGRYHTIYGWAFCGGGSWAGRTCHVLTVVRASRHGTQPPDT